MVTTRQVLEQARSLIEERSKWTHGELETEDGARCALGAIKVAVGLKGRGPYNVKRPAYREAVQALATTINPDASKVDVLAGTNGVNLLEGIVWHYNDSRGHDCVIEAMNATIEKLD